MSIYKVRDKLLSDITSVYQWTNHKEIRHRIIQDYVNDGTAKIKMFCSEENLSDPFTKSYVTVHFNHSLQDTHIMINYLRIYYRCLNPTKAKHCTWLRNGVRG